MPPVTSPPPETAAPTPGAPDPAGDARTEAQKLRDHKRNVARHVQHERIKFWIVRAVLCLAFTAIVLVLRDVWGKTYATETYVFWLSGFFLFITLTLTIVYVENYEKLAGELSRSEKPIGHRNLTAYFRENLDAITFADILFSSLLIFVISICFDLLRHEWWQAFLASAWFLIFLVTAMSTRNLLKSRPKIINGLMIMLIVFWPMMLNYMAVSVATDWTMTNAEWQAIYFSTLLRITFTIATAIVVVFLLTVPMTYLRTRALEPALSLLPARRGLKRFSTSVRNLVALKEFLLLGELHATAMSSIALGAVFYTLYDAVPTRWIFFVFNLMSIAPVLLSSLVLMRGTAPAAQKFVRRLGLQYAAFMLVVLNGFLLAGYALGYGIVQLYKYLFTPFADYPYPDRFYYLREVRLGDLPFSVQAEALVVSIIVLFALSWVVVVVQNRAWREAAYVSTLSGVVAAFPYLDFDPLELASRYFPSLRDVPSAIVALCVPALKGLFATDIERIILEDDDADTCPGCSRVVDRESQNFCPGCGQDLRPDTATADAS